MSATTATEAATATWGGRPVTVSTNPTPPLVEGRHAWTTILAFDVAGPGQAAILDHENLRSVSTFCWHCRAGADDGTPCPGRPG